MDAAEVELGVLTAAALPFSSSPYSVGQHISDETQPFCASVHATHPPENRVLR
jgi:hypothetical protein